MSPSSQSQSQDAFTIERHGEATLIAANAAIESLDASLEEQVASTLMGPIRRQVAPQVVFDLSEVGFVGSMFLAVLLRCWKTIRSSNGTMVLSGVSAQARELLRVTSLDQVWAIYPDRREAIAALNSD